jgi:hypothetical protein
MEEKIMLLDIEQSSGGAINPGDQIVKIDSDDISAWTLMRGKTFNACLFDRIEFAFSTIV